MTGPLLPLRGMHVVDLTRNVAGPYAAMILGELGADVVKVENPGRGDDTREWGPPFWDGEGPIFLAMNRNKRSVSLDLRSEDAREVMTRLVGRADALLESFRPGAMDRLGYGYAWATAVNPGLVYCSVTAYGDDGPLRDRPGYDPLMQAFGGVMSVTGEPDGPPVRVGVSLVDMGTGMWAAMAVLAALLQRREDGLGRRVVTSLYETSLAWMAYHLATFWAAGESPGRHGSGAALIVPYQAFPTGDGHLMIAAPNDALFGRLCRVLGHPEWPLDPRFARNRDRVENRRELVGLVSAATAGWAAGDLCAALAEVGVPSSPIRDAAGAAGDPQTLALGIVQEADHPLVRDFRSVGLPFLVDGHRQPLRRRPPGLGEHDRDVLAELGLATPEEAQPWT
ncbi:MAG TPA: CoA transferase [Candidatus Dormibacteraeota bacterium]|nr:CoA transferase [Candidatus Dormibacteraeota bacterium]